MSAEPAFIPSDEPLPDDWFDFDPEAADDGFTPVNGDDANRLLFHHRRIKARIAKDTALCDAERQRLDVWLQDRTAGPLRQLAAIERALEGWARMAHAADPKVLTHSLPNGTLRLRPARARVEVTDAEALVAWAKTADRFDLLTVAPSKSALAKLEGKLADETEDCVVESLIADGGEVVPGASLVTAKAPGFSLTPAKEWGKK